VTRHFLIIGAQRSGTTYLRTLLDAHPDIAMNQPASPEPKVFMSEVLAGRGLDWYRSTYFAHVTTETMLGDKSTSYIESADAATRAAAMLGEAIIIVLLRDPVDRAVSNWRFSTDNGYENRPLEEALRDNLRESRPWTAGDTSVSPYLYLERGRYAAYLPAWLAAFSGNVQVLFLQDLLMRPRALADLYARLGVEPEFVPNDLGEPVHQSSDHSATLAPSLVDELRAYFAVSDHTLAQLVESPVPWPSHG
jgi:Sulfotransferase domain